METNIENHLRALIQLSIIDRDYGEPERSYVKAIAKANKISEERLEELVRITLQDKEDAQIEVNFDSLMEEERFDYLYDIIQLMKIDGEVYLTEIRYCEDIADKLGYKKKVVKSMASRIYSDPTITTNRALLFKESKKYLK